MNIVFLDRDCLHSRPLHFNFNCHYTEYPSSTPEEINQRLIGNDIIIVNKAIITAEHIAANPQIKLIAVTATGYNNIDIAAAKAAGIAVCNVPAYSTNGVAEHAIMMMLALTRNLPAYLRDVAAGMWQKSPIYCHYGAPLHDVFGKTITIIGRGNIGRRIGELASAFGMTVVWAEHKNATAIRDGYTDFQAALKQADVVSLNCPLNESTHHLISEAELQIMKPNAILLNVGRGGLADEQAVLAALKYGTLGGAGFDVLSIEPPTTGNPLLTHLPNLIVTPHMAWGSVEAIERLVSILEQNINQFVAGKIQNNVA
ncbi:MAG: D-2-hydroxyacid dehydrogenase [Kingella sp. (in: b-proteobacteria)]